MLGVGILDIGAQLIERGEKGLLQHCLHFVLQGGDLFAGHGLGNISVDRKKTGINRDKSNSSSMSTS